MAQKCQTSGAGHSDMLKRSCKALPLGEKVSTVQGTGWDKSRSTVVRMGNNTRIDSVFCILTTNLLLPHPVF